MKKLLSFFWALAFASGSLTAQITLTVSDLANAGDFVVNSNIPYSAAAPAAGAAQTYDLTDAGAATFRDTTYYINAAGTPFASAMTGANICQQGPGSFTYFVRNNTGFYLKGFVFQIPSDSSFIQLPSEFVFAFSPQIPIMTFPATLGMNLTTQSTSSRVEIPFDTVISINGVNTTIKKIGVKLNISDTSKIDGWGTATFPFPGAQYPVLRNSHNMALSTTLEVYVILFANFGTWIPMPASLIPAGLSDFLGGDIRDVMLWTNGRKQPLTTLSLDSNGAVNRAEFQSDLLLLPTGTLVSERNNYPDFYPNPASSAVNIRLSENALMLRLRDVNGRMVKEIRLQEDSLLLETSSLPDGIYQLEMQLASGELLRKKLVVSH